MRKIMYSLILSLVLDNLIYAVGNCDIIYEMCEETFCTVEKLPQKDLYFSTENVGQK